MSLFEEGRKEGGRKKREKGIECQQWTQQPNKIGEENRPMSYKKRKNVKPAALADFRRWACFKMRLRQCTMQRSREEEQIPSIDGGRCSKGPGWQISAYENASLQRLRIHVVNSRAKLTHEKQLQTYTYRIQRFRIFHSVIIKRFMWHFFARFSERLKWEKTCEIDRFSNLLRKSSCRGYVVVFYVFQIP